MYDDSTLSSVGLILLFFEKKWANEKTALSKLIKVQLEQIKNGLSQCPSLQQLLFLSFDDWLLWLSEQHLSVTAILFESAFIKLVSIGCTVRKKINTVSIADTIFIISKIVSIYDALPEEICN